MITLPEMPARMARLPKDHRGYPVPWFVQWENGEPDFRTMGVGKWAEAVRFSRCWICGQQLGRNMTFVVGPMCTVNLTSAEPPCHMDCALFAAKACPFLTRPKMRRNDKDLPEHRFVSPAMNDRNPGGVALWTTRSFRVFPGVAGEPLAEMGPPTEAVLWFKEGREATREEVLEMLESGLESQQGLVEQEPTEELRAEGRVLLRQRFNKALELVPR